MLNQAFIHTAKSSAIKLYICKHVTIYQGKITRISNKTKAGRKVYSIKH